MRAASPRQATTPTREPVVVLAFNRGLDIFRVLAALYAAWLIVLRHEQMLRAWIGITVGVVLLAWSLAALLLRRRDWWTVSAETGIAVVGILATMAAESPDSIAAGQFTLPTLWAAVPAIGAAVVGGVRGGLAIAAVVALADLVEVGFAPTTQTVHNIVLLLLLGGLIGLAVDVARAGQAREDELLREQERLRERERLARVVHDGVLQALAYIHRRGPEVGEGGLELAEVAAEQERSLRRLVSDVSAPRTPGAHAGAVDLRGTVEARESEAITVVTPADPVLVDRFVSDELDAALAAVLDNVAQHAGPGARAWVLLDAHHDTIELTVRDDGVGAVVADVLSAADRGRMGVRAAIRGRVEDLGGSATWESAPGAGCTVRIVSPRLLEVGG